MAKRTVNTLVHELVSSWKYTRWDKFNPQPLPYSYMNKRGDTLCDDFITLDTETSWNHDEENPVGWIYQWALTYKGEVVYGRRPSELLAVLNEIKRVNQLGEYAISEKGSICHKIDIYVHNLSYDYAYIGDWLRDTFGCLYRSGMSSQSMLAIAPHSLISYECSGFVFKCSYKLTHKSLAQWGKDVNTPHRKLVDTVDYDAIHYQDSELAFSDWKYMFYDVIVLDECMRQQLRIYNDDLISVPLTVTGYVRREVKNEYLKDKRNRYGFLNRKLNVDVYNLCREEFAGGLTHGNRSKAEKTIRPKNGEFIRHRDFRSHYPSQQRAYDFPVGKPYIYFSAEKAKERGCKAPTIRRLLELSKTQCILAKIRIKYAALKNSDISIPYLQKCKVDDGFIKECSKKGLPCYIDNGRVLEIGDKEGKLSGFSIVVNEDDLRILLYMYNMVVCVEKVVTMKRGRLPKYLIDSIDNFFKGKTDYKDQVKELEALKVKNTDVRFIEACTNLMIAKGLLNGIYGMSATDPIRTTFYEEYEELDKYERWKMEHHTEEQTALMLEDYYTGKSAFSHFMDYQFGLWTTSHARLELIKFCIIVGWENVLYCDTDSIFYLSNAEIEEKIEKANKACLEHSEKVGAFIVSNKGKKVHYDQFELEKEDIVSFRFLHAKCYAYEKVKYRKDGKPMLDENGNKQLELVTVIAGVKKIGKDENGKTITREEELGSIDNLSPNVSFIHCGGITKKYEYALPHIEYINGHKTEVASSCILMKSTKMLKPMEIVIWENSNVDYVYREEE